jgi:aspartate racemase
MHKVAPQIEDHISIPLLHIADAAGRAIRAQGLKKVGLLGAIYTMEEGFYRQRLWDKFGIEVVTPPRLERELIHRVIFTELCRGELRPESRRAYLEIISGLREQGGEGVILGCTEIPLLVKAEDCDLPLFNTAALHAEYALVKSFAETLPGI